MVDRLTLPELKAKLKAEKKYFKSTEKYNENKLSGGIL